MFEVKLTANSKRFYEFNHSSNSDMNTEFDSWFKENFLKNLAESNRFVTMYLALDLLLKHGGHTIVETGTLRKENNWGAGMSTLVFGSFCKRYNHILHTVDINQEAMDISRSVTGSCNSHIFYYVNNSISFLKKFKEKIDLLYLDSMDCPPQEEEGSPQLVASQKHQLAEIEEAFDKLHDETIVLLDDNHWPNGGKTRLSKLFLQEKGFTETFSWTQSLWVKV